jgi:hypothetical protein
VCSKGRCKGKFQYADPVLEIMSVIVKPVVRSLNCFWSVLNSSCCECSGKFLTTHFSLDISILYNFFLVGGGH